MKATKQRPVRLAKSKREIMVCVWHELKSAEGGRGRYVVDLLKSEGVKAQAGYSHFVGHIGIFAPQSQVKKAERICAR